MEPRRRRVVAALLAPGVLAAALSDPAPATANCLVGYADCVDAASELDSFWKRSAQGLVCFVDLVACLQGSLG
jgi:hypothetical protein